MEKLADFLIEASTKIGVQATRIWPDLVKIVWIQCIFYSLVAIITIYACYRGIRFFLRLCKKDFLSPDGEIALQIGTVVCAGGLFLIAMFALSTLGDNLPGIFFPEAKYVSYLVNTFAKAK